MPGPVMQALLPVLREAEAELADNLVSWLSQVNGSERFTAFQYRRALIQIKEAQAAIARVSKEMSIGLRKSTITSTSKAKEHLSKELTKFSLRFDASLNPIPLLQAARLVQKATIQRLDRSAKKWETDNLRRLRRQLSIGLVKGENFDQLTNRLLGRGFTKKFSEFAAPADKAAGIAQTFFKGSEAEARRVVRTEVIQAYNEIKDEAIVNLAAETGIKFKRKWSAALDRRVCPLCRDLDGKTADLDKEFPGGYTAPPAHPNCRCALVAWRDEWG